MSLTKAVVNNFTKVLLAQAIVNIFIVEALDDVTVATVYSVGRAVTQVVY